MADRFNLSDVMISYSRRDKPFVQKLERAITKTGRETWVDWEDIPPTVDWWQEIQAGIEAAHTFIFVISPNSIRSDVCYQEIEHAVLHNKRIIPVLYQEITDPADKERIHPALSTHNWIFFRQEDDARAAFKVLMGAIATDFDHVRQHTRLLVLANEWKDNHRKNSLLLRGDDLRNAEAWLQGASAKDPAPTGLQIAYITASRKSVSRVMRMGATVTGIVMMMLIGLTLFALTQSEMAQQSFSDLENAVGEVSTQQARLTELDATVAGAEGVAVAAGQTQAAAVETQVAAQTLGAEAGQEAQTAQAAEGTAQAAQATANANQQTAEAAQATSDAALSTSQVEQATVQAEAATAAAGQSTASSAQQTAQAAEGTAQAAADQAATQQAEADALRQTAEAAEQAAGDEAEEARENANAALTQAALQEIAAQTAAANANIAATQAAVQEFAAMTEAANAANAAATAAAEAIRAETEAARAAAEATNAAQIAATAVAEATNAAALNEVSNTSILMQEAQRQLELGNRPLALHLALQAVDRPGLTQPISVNTQLAFQEVVYSPGLQYILSAGDSVTAMTYNPSGTRLLTGDDSGEIVVWDVLTARRLWSVSPGDEEISSLSFSPAGNYFASRSEDHIRVWEPDPAEGPDNWKQKTIISTGYQYTYERSNIAFSRDGNRLVSTVDNHVHVWNTNDGQVVHTYSYGDFEEPNFVAYTDIGGGTHHITIAEDDNIHLYRVTYDAETNGFASELIQTIEQSGYVESMTHSPTGEYLVTGDTFGTVRIWRTSDYTLFRETQAHNEKVVSVAFNHDETQLITASEDATVRLWDFATGVQINQFRNPRGMYVSMVANPQYPYVATVNYAPFPFADNQIRILHLDDGRDSGQQLERENTDVHNLSFNADGDRLTVDSSRSTVYDSETWQQIQTFSPDGGQYNYDNLVAHHPLHSSTFATVTGDYFDSQEINICDEDGCERVDCWEFESDTDLRFSAISYSPSGADLVVWNDYPINESLFFLEPSINNSNWECHSRSVSSSTMTGMAFSPDGTRLATGHWDGDVIIWDVANKQPLFVLENAHSDEVHALAFGPDGLLLASGSHDFSIRLWNTANGTLFDEGFIGLYSEVSALAFHPSGTQLAGGGASGAIVLWNLDSQIILHTMYDHTREVTALAFHPDYPQLVSGDSSGNVHVRDIPTINSARARACNDLYVSHFTADELAVYSQYGVTGNHYCADAVVNQPLLIPMNTIVTVTPEGYIPAPPTRAPLPTVPTVTAVPSVTPTWTATMTPSSTTTIMPSQTVTLTVTPTATIMSSSTVTATSSSTVTATPSSTTTVMPSQTVTLTVTPTATLTPSSTVTATPSSTAVMVTATPTLTMPPPPTPTLVDNGG